MVLPQIQVIFTETTLPHSSVSTHCVPTNCGIVSVVYSCLFCTNGVYIIINLFTALFQCPFLFYKLSNVRVL